MASATRSKRAEGVNPHTRSLAGTNTRTRNNNNTSAVHQIPLPNSKRRRDDPDRIHDATRSPKRSRLMINLSSSPKPQQLRITRPDGPANSHQARMGLRAAAAPANKLPKPHPPPSQTRHHRPQPPEPQLPRQQQQTQQTPLNEAQQRQEQQPQPRSEKPSNLVVSKQQSRARHAVDRELGKLQAGAAGTKAPEGRKLRSQEATRFKSDLAAYFPDYDEVIGNDKRPEYILEKDTPIVVVGSAPFQSAADYRQIPPKIPAGGLAEDFPIRSYGDNLFTDLVDSQEISFAFLEGRNSNKAEDCADPLPDSYFEPTHKKAERAEKSLRNSERGRAQHEKEQIIRLLGGLQGHDWLRTMGVSGITESKKREFEAPRQYFIKGCESILEKFRRWNQEEKRRKMEKGRALVEASRLEYGGGPESEEEGGDVGDEVGADDGDEEDRVSNDSRDGESDGDPPSDVDASIAKQLREEAMARSRVLARKAPQRSRKDPAAKQPLQLQESEPPVLKPYTSFFQKKYQRDAALSKSRRKGRTVLAWGQTIPDMTDEDFELPVEFLDEKTLRSNERRKRRDKRGTK